MAQDELPAWIRSSALLVIGALIGGAAGYFLSPTKMDAAVSVQPDAMVEHDHSMHAGDDAHDEASHSNLWEHPEGTPAPTLDMTLEPDPGGGYVLHLITSNFAFKPSAGGNDAAPGEGHAHLYVNGDKIARLYAPWFHLTSLPSGEAEVVVTLNTHDHQTVAVSGAPVKASRKITN